MDSLLTLQPRLRAIAELVPTGKPLADIGTDHGYLPVWLLQERRIPSAIASDIVPGPLDHARRTAAQYHINEHIAFRLCSGLEGISEEETETIVIAGMGGETIVKILAAAPWTKNGKTLLLQPMTKTELLRCWLLDNGYYIHFERLVLDKGIIYPILYVTGGEGNTAAAGELQYGWVRDDDPLFRPYLDELIKKTQWAVHGLERAENNRQAEKLAELKALLSVLEDKKCTL